MKRNSGWNQRKTQELFEAVLSLKTKEECRKFFRDLCTLEEMAAMADRWQAVKMIKTGDLAYREIAEKLEMSTTTVARVAHWLNYGAGGYKLILQRLAR